MEFKNTVLNNREVGYASSLENNNILLIIGRNNYEKGSIPLQEISSRLLLPDVTVIWYGTDHNATKIRLKNTIKFLLPNAYLQKIVRNIISAILLLIYHARWSCIVTNKNLIMESKSFSSLYQNLNETKKLREFVQFLGEDKKITILSHSAGGRISSSIESEKNIVKLICFGYPFKHPNEAEESTRVAHLENMKTPFLIIQGKEDEYGGIDAQNRYKFSSSVTLSYINTDHNFNDLTEEEWLQITAQINEFII